VVLVDTKGSSQYSDINSQSRDINSHEDINDHDSVIWWKIGKNQLNSQLSNGMPEFITVAPEDILLLID